MLYLINNTSLFLLGFFCFPTNSEGHLPPYTSSLFSGVCHLDVSRRSKYCFGAVTPRGGTWCFHHTHVPCTFATTFFYSLFFLLFVLHFHPSSPIYIYQLYLYRLSVIAFPCCLSPFTHSEVPLPLPLFSALSSSLFSSTGLHFNFILAASPLPLAYVSSCIATSREIVCHSA